MKDALGIVAFFTTVIIIVLQVVSFINGCWSYSGQRYAFRDRRDECTVWPRTRGDLLIPGFKVGCMAAEFFGEEL